MRIFEERRKLFSFIMRFTFLGFLFYLAYTGFWHILVANLLVFLLLFLPVLIRKSYILKVPLELEFVFLVFLAFASLIGQIFPSIAQFLFGLTMGFLGFVIIFLFVSSRGSKISYRFAIFLSFCISLALASCVEIIKFYVKLLLGYAQSFGDYSFAISNLVFVLSGSLISAVGGYVYLKSLRGKLLSGFVKKFKSENPNLFNTRTQTLDEVRKMILSGEGEKIEFKSTLRTNLETGQTDYRVENSALKSIASFLNSFGGYLFIGVSNSSRILGLEYDHFENLDFFNRHLTNLIKEKIGAEYLPYLGFDFFKIEDKTILRISCMKSNKPVFLKVEGREDFFVRVGASTILLAGNKLLDYIHNKFGDR